MKLNDDPVRTISIGRDYSVDDTDDGEKSELSKSIEKIDVKMPSAEIKK